MNAYQMSSPTEPGFIRGWWFYFDVEGHQVAVHGSALTGRERIWIDDEEVVNMISWQFRTEHRIAVDGRPLIVEFAMEDWKTGHVSCELKSDGARIAFAESRLMDTRSFWKSMAIGMASGAVVGWVVALVLGI